MNYCKMLIFYYLLNLFICGNCQAAGICTEETSFVQYYKIKSCHKSVLPFVGLKNVPDLINCKKFAREKKGLAFNFSPTEFKNIAEGYFKNCQILGCPELGNKSTLKVDEMFDYYSAFGNYNTTENATCFKSIGVFSPTQLKGNYTESTVHCQSLGADLANILSESRTNQLAVLVNSSVSEWYKAAYIGLNDIENEGTFQLATGMSITCTKFRAWGPGQPRSRHEYEDCVILDSDKTWKVVNCNTKLFALCELFPERPLMDEFKEIEQICWKIESEEKKMRCLAEKRSLSDLIRKSSRKEKCALLDMS